MEMWSVSPRMSFHISMDAHLSTSMVTNRPVEPVSKKILFDIDRKLHPMAVVLKETKAHE